MGAGRSLERFETRIRNSNQITKYSAMKLRTLKLAGMIATIMFLTGACEDEEENKGQINAVFSYVADGFKVNFTDFSENAREYTWDFGDGSEGSAKPNTVQIGRAHV